MPPRPAQVGTPAWFEQHDALEQLNLQAHLNAQAHGDEYVKEALVSHDRLTPLVHELLAAEVGAGGCWPPAAAWVRPGAAARAAACAPPAACPGAQRAVSQPACTRAPRAAQVWRQRVLPHLEAHLAAAVDSVTSYQLLYHEAALANLLEARGRGGWVAGLLGHAAHCGACLRCARCTAAGLRNGCALDPAPAIRPLGDPSQHRRWRCSTPTRARR